MYSMIIVCERRINMHYITIPVWVFVIIIILASITVLFILLIIIGIIAAFVIPVTNEFDDEYNPKNGYNPDDYDPDTYENSMELKKDKKR